MVKIYPKKKKKKKKKKKRFLIDRKCHSNFVYIILKACHWLLDCTSFVCRSKKWVQENWLQIRWGSVVKSQKNCDFVMLSLMIKLSNANRLSGPKGRQRVVHWDSLLIFDLTLLGILVVWLSYMVVDYIPEINLTKRKKIWEWFYSLLMVLSNQTWCRIDKKQGLSSAVSLINDKVPIFVVRNCYRGLLTIALMPIKQFTVFRCLLRFLQTFGLSNITRLNSSLFTHKMSKERHRTHTPYADTSVLYTLCVDNALMLSSQKVHAIKEEQILHAVL